MIKLTYCDLIFMGIFLPITILLYNIIPQKHRAKILLIASYIFFWSISGKLIIYLLATTLLMYVFSLVISKKQNKRKIELQTAEKKEKKIIKEKYLKKTRLILVFNVVILLGMVLVLKYSSFIGNNINSLFNLIGHPINLKIAHFAIPIGISFYTLQAISYMIDVYKEKIEPDKNLGRLALFISFFPQIMEGPICRYEETAIQLWKGERTSYKSLTFGIQRIGLGLMKKLIIADRLDILVSNVFSNYGSYDGGISAIAMILYTLQLYMDFSGVMDIVIGIGEIFNVKMPENFKQPFFSKSVSEFWTRWHITLGAWFRDYIYYPVSMSKKSKKMTTTLRKKIGKYYGPLLVSSVALFCVWICNGIWHGSAWNYIFFGMYHFAFILTGRFIEPISKNFYKKLKISEKNKGLILFKIIRTTVLVFFGELFFRAEGLKAGFNMFGKIFTNFSLNSLSNGEILKLGLNWQDFMIVGLFTVVFLIISIRKEQGNSIRENISKKNITIRWTCYFAIIFAIIIFGAYGEGYVPVDPMYAQF